jgi:RNA polymerase sigma-70 factor (ECF subfamily)
VQDPHTQTGGPQGEFPRTTAGFEAQLGNPATVAQEAAIATLAQRYWKPVYCWLRAAFAKQSEDAKDLTQAFFAWLLERDLLTKYEPARSSFRTYLKGVLRNFAGNEHQTAHRLKRGGTARVLPIDVAALDAVDPGTDPDRAFDRLWMNDVVDRAVARVRERFAAAGRPEAFRAFEAHDLTPDGNAPTYAEVAERLGVKESDVRNWLFEVREQIRLAARADLGESSGDADAFREEWDEFLRG